MRRRLVASAVGPLLLFTLPVFCAPASAVPSPPLLSECPATTPGALNSAPSIPGTNKTVELTFDDGPGRSTQQIIDILNSFHVRATFFNVGVEITHFSSLVREEAADGFLLGNHSEDHPVMPSLSAQNQFNEINTVIHKQWALTKTVPCSFRPPYGDFNATTQQLVSAAHESLWMWSDGGGDWLAHGSGSAYWIHYIETAVIHESYGQNHPVILLHNQPIFMPATVAALPTIIRFFLSHGYSFVDALGRSGEPGVCSSPNTRAPVALFSSLQTGDKLASGATFTSPSGQYRLSMQNGGDLVLSLSAGRSLWDSGTSGHAGATLVVNANGTVSVKSSSNAVLWTSPGANNPGASLELSNDGNLSLAKASVTSWSTHSAQSSLRAGDHLVAGWSIYSPDGRCRLTLTTSGSLRLLGGNVQTLWSNAPLHLGASVATLQADGNLVTRSAHGTLAWSSSTGAHAHDRLDVTNKGTLVIRSNTGAVLWATQ